MSLKKGDSAGRAVMGQALNWRLESRPHRQAGKPALRLPPWPTAINFDGFRPFPMISNQFQSLLKK
jgi:hypothetical protein